MVELADLCDELKKCYELVTEQERQDCFCRVDRLMDEYFRRNPASTSRQQTESGPV